MIDIIERYIKYMRKKYNIIACMVVGSYVTGEMGPRSDIDLFFIWNNEFKSMRGREYFEGIEFEYFISPEWKYYDRLRTDMTSMRIYSTAKILVDHEHSLSKIQKVAKEKVNNYTINLSVEQRIDYKFWLETFCNDAEDLFHKKDYSNFQLFVGANLPKLNDLCCMLHNELPTYVKYGVKEIKAIDSFYGDKLEEYLSITEFNPRKIQTLIELCDYLQTKLGDYDIKNYERISVL